MKYAIRRTLARALDFFDRAIAPLVLFAEIFFFFCLMLVRCGEVRK